MRCSPLYVQKYGDKVINKLCLQKNLLRLAAQRTNNFVGLGVISYKTFPGLPVVPLGSRLDREPDLPVSGASNVMRTLAALATRVNSMHDGFHLIEASSGNLTHVAQFVSPPLGVALSNPLIAWPQGARQMTALLISTLPQVELAAVISAEGRVHFYKNGSEEKSGACQ